MANFPYEPPPGMWERYRDSSFSRCPNCNSEEISAVEAHDSAMEIHCNSCSFSWLDCHEIVGILLAEQRNVE